MVQRFTRRRPARTFSHIRHVSRLMITVRIFVRGQAWSSASAGQSATDTMRPSQQSPSTQSHKRSVRTGPPGPLLADWARQDSASLRKPSSAAPTCAASSCCLDAGAWSAPWAGCCARGAWPTTTRRSPPPAKPSCSGRWSCSWDVASPATDPVLKPARCAGIAEPAMGSFITAGTGAGRTDGPGSVPAGRSAGRSARSRGRQGVRPGRYGRDRGPPVRATRLPHG